MKKIVYILLLSCLSLCCACSDVDNQDDSSEHSAENIEGVMEGTDSGPKSGEENVEDQDLSDINNLHDEKETDQYIADPDNAGQNDEGQTMNILSTMENDGQDEEDTSFDNQPTIDTDSANQIAQQNSETYNENITNKIAMALNSSSITRELLSAVTVTITNNSDYNLISGEAYSLEKLSGSGWEQIPLAIAWNDLGVTITAGNSYNFNYNLNSVAEFESGATYRLVKSVYMDQNEYILYAEFTVQ